jgi:hypothetical protein
MHRAPRGWFQILLSLGALFLLHGRTSLAQPAVEPEGHGPAPIATGGSTEEPPHKAAPPTAVAPVLDPNKIESCLKALPPLGSLDDLQSSAIDSAMVSPRHVAAVLRSAKRKGLLPTVYVLGLYNGQAGSSESTLQDYAYHNTFPWKEKTDLSSAVHGGYVGVMLRFDFGKTALGTEEFDSVKVTEARNNLLEKVNSLYYAREKLALDLCGNEHGEVARRGLELRIREVTSLLESLGGRRAHRDAGSRH